LKYLFFLFAATIISYSGFSQNVDSIDNRPIYIRFPTIPEFTIYKAPDSTAFSRDNLHKRKAGHCQHETDMLLQDINKFKNTQIVMVTYLPYDEMMKFYKIYHIANYPQITMGRDSKFFFPVFFKIQNLPSIFVYDKKGNFKKKFEGDVKPESILAEL
jgi:hypothetical protein